MSDLGERLARLGLSQYLEAFVSEGFDAWETVLDITESDLASLRVKLGHRRKLQRVIAESRGQSSGRSLSIAFGKAGSVDVSCPVATRLQKQKPGWASSRHQERLLVPSGSTQGIPRGQGDFERTGVVFHRDRQGCRRAVAECPCRRTRSMRARGQLRQDKYCAKLTEYKKTPEYEVYQEYLEEFKAKHAALRKEAEGKRSKMGQRRQCLLRATGTIRLSAALDEKSAQRSRTSTLATIERTERSPPIGPAWLPSRPSHPSKSTSPAVHARSGFNSPRMADYYSPFSASPRSATLQKENSFETIYSALATDARSQSDASLPYSPSYGHGPSYTPSTTPPSYSSHYQTPIDLPSRRPAGEMNRLPSLIHNDTTLSSSDSGQSGYTASYTGQAPANVDTSKSMRTLPAPISNGIASVPSPFDRPSAQPALKTPQHQHPDYGTNSSLVALLRPTELPKVSNADADADDEEMDTPRYP
ncbi:hypothetical protein PMIN03_012248 [Paraphaeosphaeria minitans]